MKRLGSKSSWANDEMKKVSGLLLIFVAFTSLFVSCGKKSEPIVKNDLSIGTLNTITFYTSDDASLAEEAFSIIHEKEAVFSARDEKSELFRVNAEAYEHPVAVSDELFDLIALSLEIAEKTDGAFNPAIGPLVKLWGIGTDDARVPSQSEIDSVLPLLDWRNVILDERKRTVSFSLEGMSIDLGAIAKGRISECVKDFLVDNGVGSAIINLGGNVVTVGTRTDGRPWSVGIRKPEIGSTSTFTSIKVVDAAVLTSGAYERYFESDGKIYHHILSSTTGCPSDSDLVSATIISEDPTLGDALSTACYSAGLEKAGEFCEAFDVSGVFLTKDGEKVVISPGEHGLQ